MPKVRLKSPEYDCAVFDGRIVGLFDEVVGMVQPETRPAWFEVREVETLKLIDVVEGEFIQVIAAELYHGEDGKWRKVEAGARILYWNGEIKVISAFEYLRDYEPA